MDKQDRQGVRTPTDIERKYDLGKIKKIKDYFVECGSATVGDVTWDYEKKESGTVKMSCNLIVPCATAYILERQGIYFPFELVEDAIGFVSINEWGDESEIAPKNPRILCRNNRCTVQVINHLGGFTADSTANVAVCVLGKWK